MGNKNLLKKIPADLDQLPYHPDLGDAYSCKVVHVLDQHNHFLREGSDNPSGELESFFRLAKPRFTVRPNMNPAYI